jgi:hypothetical protein
MSIEEATGVAGQSATAVVNPESEATYWSENYGKRAYVEPARPYGDYQPAYQYGWESRARMGNRPFREVETELGGGWEQVKATSTLGWTQARSAVSDAWHRAGRPPVAVVEPAVEGA